MSQTATTQEPSAHSSETHGASPSLLAPEIQVILLTWVTFFVLFTILSKFAWKPILAGLQAREDNIRKAVDEAAKTREEYKLLGEKRHKILSEADASAKEFMNQARQTALKTAKVIEERVAQEAVIMVENARREIDAEQEKAAVYLREKSADTAVALATKILQEKLDTKNHKELVDRLIEEI